MDTFCRNTAISACRTISCRITGRGPANSLPADWPFDVRGTTAAITHTAIALLLSTDMLELS
jgi:hypothetical protein